VEIVDLQALAEGNEWIVDMHAPYLGGVTPFIASGSKTTMNDLETSSSKTEH
jgi:hypothetical protein